MNRSPFPRAIAEVLGPGVTHHQVGCVANPIEQDHRGIKQRYYPTLGFNHFDAAQRFQDDGHYDISGRKLPRTTLNCLLFGMFALSFQIFPICLRFADL